MYLGVLKKKKYSGFSLLYQKILNKDKYYWVVYSGGDSDSFHRIAKNHKGFQYKIDDYFNGKLVGYSLLNGEAHIINFYPKINDTEQKPLQ